MHYSAFHLYWLAWRGQGQFSIGKWKWPFDELKRRGDFAGDNPWCVLFRRAIELAAK